MAHAIIFTDRAPRTYNDDDLNLCPSEYNIAAGAYRIASVLRAKGLDVLVVSNCLSLSYKSVKRIIENNKKNLLWVGIGSSLMFVKSNMFDHYRHEWLNTDDDFVDLNIFSGTGGTKDGVTFEASDAAPRSEMVWSTGEINLLAEYLKQTYQVPLVIGGAWVTHMSATLGKVHSNIKLISGYAEKYIEEYTEYRLGNKPMPLQVPNDEYDDVGFKESPIIYQSHDYITPDMWLPLEVARGCGFNCAYCTYHRKNMRDTFRNTKSLRDELVRNYELYGVKNYMLLDDLYNDSKEKVRILYDEVWSKLPFDIEWVSYMRLDMFWADPESIDIVKASGARMGQFGIETLHHKAGKSVGKGLGRDRVMQTLEALKEKWGTDVLVSANFIAGLPYEDRASIEETMQWTQETDLIFSANWFPLWLTPPEHFEIVNEDSINKIAKNPDKWEVKWLESWNWINSEGITFRDVDKMCIEARDKLPKNHLKTRGIFGYGDYADIRSTGITHEQIVAGRDKNSNSNLLVAAHENLRQKIDIRLKRYLNTKV